MTQEELRRLLPGITTPAYVFDLDVLQARMRAIRALLGQSVELCYAMKANPFLTDAMAALCDRLEVCSPGELCICEATHVDMKKVIFSGVNKTAQTVAQAVALGAGTLTCESEKHLRLIEAESAVQGCIVPVLLRLTGGGNQFGMDEAVLTSIVKNRAAFPHVHIEGLHFFTGTQKKNTDIVTKELLHLDAFCDTLYKTCGFSVQKLEYGPGLPHPYFVGEDFTDTLRPLREVLPLLQRLGEKYRLTIEMGRFLVSGCGYYLTAVNDMKQNEDATYAILDGGIHQLNYYGQVMAMKCPVMFHFPAGAADVAEQNSVEQREYTLCGSLCTTADVLVRKAALPPLKVDDVLAFCNVGAYSVTEAPCLFLSRALPTVYTYSQQGGVCCARQAEETFSLNFKKEEN